MPMRAFQNPRLWLIGWLSLGAAGLLYVILASALSGGAPRASRAERPLNDVALLTGEMADFAYAATARRAPAATFLGDDGEMSLADFRGKIVLVNFWATWCGPCLRELPSLDALEGELGGDRFEVVAIAADPRGPEVAREFLDKLKIARLELYADPTLAFAIASEVPSVLPVSILYDAKGREIGRLVGEADWASKEARALIARAIDAN
jgi:thiol-disulfide isomerase/thioredoxin